MTSRFPHLTTKLSGWGRFPVETCRVYRPEKRAALFQLFGSDAEPVWTPRGLGRSYGDPAINARGGVIDLSRLNRMIAFDPERGLLTCEGGVSLAEIIGAFLHRGWFLPVSPGTKFVTVGGAIANDVHGKNHHMDGSFGAWVREIKLLTPTGETVVCSPETHPDVFWATVGGVGLTGIILSATIQLHPVETSWFRVDMHRTANAEEALRIMRDTEQQYQYSVAWLDALATGANLGRAVVFLGNHARADEIGSRPPYPNKHTPNVRVPFDAPGFAVNPMSIGLFNRGYYWTHPTKTAALVPYEPFFYPLDFLHEWNRLYGPQGFVQYQATFPPDGLKGLLLLLERMSRSGRPSFLTVLKCMGDANPGLLSHPMKGYTLNLDVPARRGVVEFLREADRLVLEYGGRLYLAKDSTTTADAFAAMYPRLGEFKEIQRRLDPEARMSSAMARRLNLLETRVEVAR